MYTCILYKILNRKTNLPVSVLPHPVAIIAGGLKE